MKETEVRPDSLGAELALPFKFVLGLVGTLLEVGLSVYCPV